MKKTVIIIFSLLLLCSCKLSRFVFYNFANITDYKKFPGREIKSNSTKYNFVSKPDGKLNCSKKYDNKEISFEEYLEKNKTVAFLVIQNDTIKYEKYFNKYNQEDIVASFSMAKSILSILIGIAVDEGLIKSVDEPITNYIPELKKNNLEKVTIKHLLQMTSAIRFNESYFNPFGDAATYYYGRNLRKEILKLKLKSEPGKHFEYISGSSQVLGLVLERALKDKTISQYLQEKLWQPLGMEYDASWSIDKKKNGLEKTFCCLNARARDFAKIGRLYLNNGNWNGKQIVSERWVKESTKIDTTDGSSKYYQYQWWLPSKSGDFMAQGILGQYIYVNPSKKLIIVRLGKQEGKANWWEIFYSVVKLY